MGEVVSLTVQSDPCVPDGVEVDVVVAPGDVAATDLAEGAAAIVLAGSLSFWSAEAPATGFTDGLGPAATIDETSAGLSDGTAPAAICGRSTDAGDCGPASSRHSSCTLRAF